MRWAYVSKITRMKNRKKKENINVWLRQVSAIQKQRSGWCGSFMPGNLEGRLCYIDQLVQSCAYSKMVILHSKPQQKVSERKSQNQNTNGSDAQKIPVARPREKEEEPIIPADGYTEKWPDLCDPDKEWRNTKLHKFHVSMLACNLLCGSSIECWTILNLFLGNQWFSLLFAVLLGHSYQHLTSSLRGVQPLGLRVLLAGEEPALLCLTHKSLIYAKLLNKLS